MTTQILVPTLGESVTEATVAQWYKHEGDPVKMDEPLCELETDKVSIEVPSPMDGVLSAIAVKDGETVEVGALLGSIGGAGEAPAKSAAAAAPAKAPAPTSVSAGEEAMAAPAARKIAEEHGLDLNSIKGSGKGGRVLKTDVLEAVEAPAAPTVKAPQAPQTAKAPETPPPAPALRIDEPREERVKMTRLRRTIADRLKEAQNTAAMLTTFNEVDMTAVMDLRKQYKGLFEQRHGVKLGFMSFFVRASVKALKELPAVNAEIDGEEIVYKNYYNVGVAVGTEKGLVVPVVRDADQLSLAEIEKAINGYAGRARDGKLELADLQGGTFTISNGGVYGSLMSTPILNAPQTGILGMHKIQERPIAIDGEIKIRPMMYLALSYDHRIVDGREAVTFLVRLKEIIEDPQRIALDL